MKRLLVFSILLTIACKGISQKQTFSLKDSLDNRLDVSDFLVNMNGFLPVASIITEPALGNFGVELAPLFITPQKDLKNKDRFHFPDITSLFGFYTLNESWGLGLFRMGSFPKHGIRYRVGGLYGSVNLNFYRTLPDQSEHELELNSEIFGGLLELSKSVYQNRLFAGLTYSLLNTSFSYPNSSGSLPGILDEDEFKGRLSNVGIFAEADYRNSIFTPDKGIRFKTGFVTNGDYTGSDYTFNRVNLLLNAFINPRTRWVSGFRCEASFVTSGVPFYALPYITMRGIPIMRYQGSQTLMLETEQRFDLDPRWSIVGFGGAGLAIDNISDTISEGWQWSGGAGFRYLIARIFRIRAGLDFAVGPENVAYYIVVGHNWNR